MKNIVLILSLVVSLSTQAQNFEGKIIYKNSHKSRVTAYSDAQIDIALGDKQEYYIKGNNYKSLFNGNYIKSHLYIGKENHAYTQYAQSDTLYIEDCGINSDSVISFEIMENQDTIMNIVCDMLVIKTKSGGTSKYFFNANYCEVNPEIFNRHKYGNWYFAISKMKALPLKSIIETPEFTLIVTAQEIIQMKLKEDIFILPENQPTRKLN